MTSISIPNSVTSIGEYAFANCIGLTSITLGEGVTSIGYAAFGNCKGLTSITIPNSVTSIKNSAFSYCTGLTSIKIAEGNSKYDSRDNCNAIIETTTNTLIYGCKNTSIPNSVTSIGWSAFYGCTGLKSVTLPENVTSIGESAFYGCIGLTSIIIPESVTSIGAYCFSQCTGLNEVHFKGTTPPTCPDKSYLYAIFLNGSSLIRPTIYVPFGSADAYRNALGNKYTIVEE